MSPGLLPLLVLISVSTGDFLSSHSHYLTHLDTVTRLAATERRVVGEVRGKEGLDDQLSFLLDFLETDMGGPPYQTSVLEAMQFPLDRFKVVERFILDWPQFAGGIEALTGLDVNLEFSSSPAEYEDLLLTVSHLNSILSSSPLFPSLHTKETVNEHLASPGVSLNSGNLYVMTNLSYALGEYGACAEWGEAADADLLQSDEPFTIPGEPYWLDLYVIWYECLLREGYEEEAEEVRVEIMVHYGEEAEAMERLERADLAEESQEEEDEEDWEDWELDTVCEVEIRGWLPIWTESVVGSDIVFYRGAASVAMVRQGGARTGGVLVDNSGGAREMRVGTVSQGVVVLSPGDGIRVPVGDIGRVLQPEVGLITVYSA